jgi:hypothetical protein
MRKWIVRCANYEAGPFSSRQGAEYIIEVIVSKGTCYEEHEVVEVEAGYRRKVVL